MSLTGDPDRPPSRLPGSLLDHVTGLWGALGVVSALHGPRDRVALTLSMSDIALHLLGDRVAAHLATGEVPGRMGSAIGVTTPLQAYATADSDIVIGAASDALFQRAGRGRGPHASRATPPSPARPVAWSTARRSTSG